MFLYSRRFNVWLVSFLAVLVIYFIYNRLSRTPLIATSDSRQPAELVMDACDSNDKVGKVGVVGVGEVKTFRYVTLNSQKQVEREFGFEELLHQDGNDWEIEKPYVRVYRRGFKCEMKGDRARVTVETAAGKVTPKEGLLTGDVTIRIWGAAGKAVMYLDDIAFVGDRSLFSTSGLVEYVSDDVQLTGTGMELVYNGDAERLEFLKIRKLESLHIKRWSQGTVFGSTSLTTGGSSAREKAKTSGEQPVREGKETVKPGQKYRCVLDSNVVIETPRERLFAGVVSLNDIFVSGGEANEGGAEAAPGDKGLAELAVAVDGKKDMTSATAETAGDVAVSCDGSIVVMPMDSAAGQEWLNKQRANAAVGIGQAAGAATDGKTTLRGGRVEYNVATGEAVAIGPSQITFDVNDRNRGAGAEPFDSAPRFASYDGATQGKQGRPARFEITTQRQAKFEPAKREIVFEGDCRCTVSQMDGNTMREYIVLGDKLEVDLKQAAGAEGSTSSLDVSRLVATGGEVHLASTKKAGERLLAGVEMKCVRMDYNTVDGNFLATGPGLIKMDNSRTDEPQGKLNRFSLRRRCYAFLRQFDSLEFEKGGNRLVADSKEGSLLVDYFPTVEGSRKEDKVAITASHVEADILETPQGRTELKGLVAKGAVTYEDKDNQFAGNEFVYDANSAIVNVGGTKTQLCLFNGAIVDTVRYDLKTGRVNTRIKGPGALR